ncbi:MAG: hypothetical protein ACRDIX_06585 [Actinomycetota bacterium]
MVGRLVLIAATLIGVASGSIASAPPGAGVPEGCPGPAFALEAATPSSPAARGHGLAVVQGNGLVMVGSSGERRAFRHPGSAGVLRHAASRPGSGTAYVNDVAGPDQLVVVQPGAVATVEGRGELTHPAWTPSGDLAWSVDLSVLEVWSPATAARRMVPPPRGAAAIFSPVFTAADEMVAVVGEAAGPAHDDALNDLWRYDFDGGAWTRLTRFRADADRWSVLRTPVVGPDGAVLFVRVTGRASATEPPSFQLWALRESHPSRVRDLPGEMYLAGFLGDRLVWNVPDPATGEWRLVSEGPSGSESLGCGAASVDPVAEPDPDFLEAGEKGEHPAGAEVGQEAILDETGAGLALMVGDFDSESQARSMAEELDVPGALVVGHGAAPAAVGPGAWAVAVPIPPGSLPEEALAAFRARHAGLAEQTWIVPFEPGGPER